MKGGLLKKQTQTQKILQYLEKFGSISSYEAFVELGITQLAARLRNLEDDGYVFNNNKNQMVKTVTNGKNVVSTLPKVFKNTFTFLLSIDL